MLCVFAGNAGAEDELLYPQKIQLKCKDWVIDTPDAWVDVGVVKIWNTKTDLKIEMKLDGLDGLAPEYASDLNIEPEIRMSKIAIHVVQNDSDVFNILDRKLQPSPKLFDYNINLLKAPNEPQAEYTQTITLDNFDICWGVNPEKCPPNL